MGDMSFRQEKRPSVGKIRSSIVSQIAIPHYSLTNIEKRFLLNAERGDCASIQTFVKQLQYNLNYSDLERLFNEFSFSSSPFFLDFSIIDTYKDKPEEFNIDCLDPLNRSALIIALEKENIDLINVLLVSGISVKVSFLILLQSSEISILENNV